MLNCADEDNTVSDLYTFVVPERWYHFETGTHFELGQSIEVSGSCNPNFSYYEITCEQSGQTFDVCNLSVDLLFEFGVYNENNHFETFLQCPQCGCGAEGIVNINDLYAAEQAGHRKVTDDETFLNKISFK